MTPAAVAAPVPEETHDALTAIEASVARVIQGKPEAIRLALTTLLARGHLLIEDVPGVGKTTLARALARSLGGSFRRIQFTSDLLPSDIIGVSVFNQDTSSFEFRHGPIFANIVLADEINRTTPRTQSSLLEAMSEGHVSVDNATHKLDQPFMVVATQNPQEHFGTYPLPESQMDRFLLRIKIGYPDREDERRVITEHGGADLVQTLEPVATLDSIRSLQKQVEDVRVDDAIVDYALEVIAETREHPRLALGVSTRGGIAWHRAAQAYAFAAGRSYCVPDDFKRLAVHALAHRVVLTTHQDTLGRARIESEHILNELLDRVPVPS